MAQENINVSPTYIVHLQNSLQESLSLMERLLTDNTHNHASQIEEKCNIYYNLLNHAKEDYLRYSTHEGDQYAQRYRKAEYTYYNAKGLYQQYTNKIAQLVHRRQIIGESYHRRIGTAQRYLTQYHQLLMQSLNGFNQPTPSSPAVSPSPSSSFSQSSPTYSPPLTKTKVKWTTDLSGNQIYNTPLTTGLKLCHRQGKLADYQGTCGLCSVANIGRLQGNHLTEEEVVTWAVNHNLCTRGGSVENNGGTTAENRQELLQHYGIDSKIERGNLDQAAQYVGAGHGVIITVKANKFYENNSRGYHAVTITSVKRDKSGNLLGFYLCDSNNRPSVFYEKDQLAKAMKRLPMNVTTHPIR